MDKFAFVSMNGASEMLRAQAVHTNNLANVNTAGFRADYTNALAHEAINQDRAALPTRVYGVQTHNHSDLNPGAVIPTNNPMDIAINGAGWFAVETQLGEVAYTRNGQLKVSAEGLLLNSHNQPILGTGGPITIPPNDALEIAKDGTVSIIPQGGEPTDITPIDQIRLVNPELADLRKGVDGLFYLPEGVEPEPDINIRLESGFMEGSNVNAVREMTKIIELARAFEMNLKMLESADKLSQSDTKLLQIA